MFEINGWLLYLGVLVLYQLTVFIGNTFIFTESFVIEQLEEIYSANILDNIMSIRSQFWWVSYSTEPIAIGLRLLLLYVCVSIGALLNEVEYLSTQIFKAGLIAEVSFLVAKIWVLLKIYFNPSLYSPDSAGELYPLSLLGTFGSENIVTWLHYPLQTLNLFEVFYILLISWLLSKQWKPDFVESINIVLPSYGIGLLLWMVLVVFLTLQIS